MSATHLSNLWNDIQSFPSTQAFQPLLFTLSFPLPLLFLTSTLLLDAPFSRPGWGRLLDGKLGFAAQEAVALLAFAVGAGTVLRERNCTLSWWVWW